MTRVTSLGETPSNRQFSRVPHGLCPANYYCPKTGVTHPLAALSTPWDIDLFCQPYINRSLLGSIPGLGVQWQSLGLGPCWTLHNNISPKVLIILQSSPLLLIGLHVFGLLFVHSPGLLFPPYPSFPTWERYSVLRNNMLVLSLYIVLWSQYFILLVSYCFCCQRFIPLYLMLYTCCSSQILYCTFKI